MEEVTLVQLIGSVGFPIVMTIYLITKFEKTVQTNTLAVNELKEVIRDLMAGRK